MLLEIVTASGRLKITQAISLYNSVLFDIRSTTTVVSHFLSWHAFSLPVVKQISNLALKKESYSYKKLSSYFLCASSPKITMRVKLYAPDNREKIFWHFKLVSGTFDNGVCKVVESHSKTLAGQEVKKEKCEYSNVFIWIEKSSYTRRRMLPDWC